jgi:hypothetical protein
VVLRNGLLYFASVGVGRVIVTEPDGRFREYIDLISRLELEEAQKAAGVEIVGFWVAEDGSMFFTVPVLFKVFKLSPDKELSAFGRPGSAAGQFGVLAGVVTDSRGNVLVADKLKCVVMAFDKDFQFLAEFGYRGARPQNLIVPDDIAIDKNDHLFVTQGRRRGVSVFALTAG